MFGDKTVTRKDCTWRMHMGDQTVNVRPKDVKRYEKQATVKASQLTGTVHIVPHWDALSNLLFTQYGVTIHQPSTVQTNAAGEIVTVPDGYIISFFNEDHLTFWE